MFDLFGVPREAVEHVHIEQAINFVTVAQMLIDKGICTEEELLKMRLRVQPMVEQAYQKNKDEQAAQAREDNPHYDLFDGLFNQAKDDG